MKILYVTTVGSTMNFFKTFIDDLIKNGDEVHIATNEASSPVSDCYRKWRCKIFNISTSRSPLNLSNLKAVRQIKKIVKDEKYDIVHCHTPIAAMCTRLACINSRKKKTKVIYTAHGFHFFKGAPILNWAVFYPIEKMCSRWTDCLITINREDEELAKKKLKPRRVEYVPGVGVERIESSESKYYDLRAELNIANDDFIIFSVGELNKNKNHEAVLRAITKIKDEKIKYIIAGKGNLDNYLKELAKELGIEKQLFLLGFRTDVNELYSSVDCFIHPSYREGLPVSIMEALSHGVYVLASDIRGCRDLINNTNGMLFNPKDIDQIADMINHAKNRKKATVILDDKFYRENVNKIMKQIYLNQFA